MIESFRRNEVSPSPYKLNCPQDFQRKQSDGRAAAEDDAQDPSFEVGTAATSIPISTRQARAHYRARAKESVSRPATLIRICIEHRS